MYVLASRPVARAEPAASAVVKLISRSIINIEAVSQWRIHWGGGERWIVPPPPETQKRKGKKLKAKKRRSKEKEEKVKEERF